MFFVAVVYRYGYMYVVFVFVSCLFVCFGRFVLVASVRLFVADPPMRLHS